MQDISDLVRRHYGRAALLERIDDGLRASGVDPATATADDLKPVDEFHTGGLGATNALLDQLPIGPRSRVLDVGCGLGGTARHVAQCFDCAVLGVDLTPAYVAAGRALTERAGLADRVELREGSAVELPVEEGSIDVALMLHVGMNLPDKAALMREVARVLVPGGTFGLFDVMSGRGEGALVFPLPWADDPASSFVEPPSAYRAAAEAAGLSVEAERDRGAFALDYFAAVFRAAEARGTPPLGIHLLMGEAAGHKLRNYVANVEAGRAAPREMILRRPGPRGEGAWPI